VPPNGDAKHDSDFDADIVVTRQKEEHDPEAEAEFDRELAKLMAESIDSRKFDRKQMFDVPLPMRRAPREAGNAADDSPNEGTATPPNTMAFSLMTKKGNRQQVWQPSGSTLRCFID
jgi:regulator of nonsense transcripts 2